MLKTFLYPYFSLIYGASWNVQQSLEGMGIRSSSFVEYDAAGHIVSSYWSPAQALLPILELLSLLAILLSIAFVIAGYTVRRKVGGVCALLLLCFPGILNVLSLWPEIPLIPDTFVIDGSGILGSGIGIAPLLGMGVLTGWIGFILLSDLFQLGENFSHAYDHVWCLSGVVAAAFFVADSQVGEHVRNLQESVKTVQAASTYLSRQVTIYDQWCNVNQKQNTASCRWAANIQQKLLDYSTQGAKLYREFGPQSSADIYSTYGHNIEAQTVATIRMEIESYNSTVCPVTQLGPGVWQHTQSARCLMTPAEYCFAPPERLNGQIKTQMGDTAALSSECIIPSLVALRTRQEKLLQKTGEDLQAKHYRWIYYLFFSIVVGGKIATSTVKLFSMHRRTAEESRRSLHLIKRCVAVISKIFLFSLKMTARAGIWSCNKMYKANDYLRLHYHRLLSKKSVCD